jgi:hypothetical protein
MIRFSLIPVVALSAVLPAQDKVDISIKNPKQPVRYTIESRSSNQSEREVLVDGEPMGGGRGGFGGAGAGGATKRETRLVFDEGQGDGGTWRVYHTATAKSEMPGRDGEPATNEVEGGLVGMRLRIVEDDRGTVVEADGEEAEELSPMATRGVPAATSFAGITPAGGVEIGAEFELPAAFFTALQGIDHPIRPAMDPNAFGGRGARPQGGNRPQGGGDAAGGGGAGGGGAGGDGAGRGGRGQRGQRPQGGEGGDTQGTERPQRGQRAAGGFGGRGGMAGMMGMLGGDQNLTLIANDKLEGKVLGKIVEVKDGVAKIEFQGVRAVEGDIAELGMSMLGGGRGGRGGFGGRGGQGGGQGGGFGVEGEGSMNVELAGAIWVNVDQHALVKLVVEGKSTTWTEARMGGGDREIEMSGSSEGEFRYAVETGAAETDK